jgi:hypothetical protein
MSEKSSTHPKEQVVHMDFIPLMHSIKMTINNEANFFCTFQQFQVLDVV